MKETFLPGALVRTDHALTTATLSFLRVGKRMHWGAVYLWIVALISLLAGKGAWGQSNSASYILQQSTINGGGTTSNSGSYRLSASMSQETTIGASSSPGHVLQSGFWSFAGSGLVPVLLTVRRNAAMPGNVDLSWSGNNPPYDIYQATDCVNVFGSFFATTTANSYSDIPPPATQLVCYNVLATAPGPAPPPAP